MDQYSRVRDFHDRLASEGTSFGSFKKLEDFEQQLRIHLAREIPEYAQVPVPQPTSESRSDDQGARAPRPMAEPHANDQGKETESDELGLLDFPELAEEHFGLLNEVTRRLAKETESIGEKMRSRAEEISAATAGRQLGCREARRRSET